MKINCALVDDNLHDIQVVKSTLLNLFYGTNTMIEIDTFHNSDNPHILEKYDLYIFDIDMPNTDGFALANSIYERYPQATIIFCTMHDNLVYDSFKLNAFYFVRKRNLEEDLSYSIKKYLSYYDKIEHYAAKTADGVLRIRIDSIIYFEVVHNHVYIHLKNNSEIKERKTLQKVYSELNNIGFIQIGKSFLVNLAHVENINNYQLHLDNNQIISIPKTQYKKVRESFLTYYSR